MNDSNEDTSHDFIWSEKELKKTLCIAKQEGLKNGNLGSTVNYMVVNLNIVDKDGLYDLPKEVIDCVVKNFRERAPDTGAVFVSVGQKTANVIVNIPKSRTEITTINWSNSLNIHETDNINDKTYEFEKYDITSKKKVNWSSLCYE